MSITGWLETASLPREKLFVLFGLLLPAQQHITKGVAVAERAMAPNSGLETVHFLSFTGPHTLQLTANASHMPTGAHRRSHHAIAHEK